MHSMKGFSKRYKIVCSLIIMCSSSYCLGQRLTVTDSGLIHNAKVIILSEWHLLDHLPPYKRQLIEKLYKDEGLTDLVLETGRSTAYLLNEYVATGDTSIINNFPLFTQSDKDYWKAFRKYKLPSGKLIKIHGIDFERMSIVPALKRVLKKTRNTNNELYQYLIALPDTIGNLYKYDTMIAERSAIIQKCVSIYQSNAKYYRSIYDNGFIVKEICENRVVETEWDKRFDAMAHNLRLLYKDKLHKYLLIVGITHVDYPTPIYIELEQAYKLQENDIVNIALVVKDCETENMYTGRREVRLGASQSIWAQPGLIDSLYMYYVRPCDYQLVDVKTRFPNYKPSFKCDYILPVDCKSDDSKCN